MIKHFKKMSFLGLLFRSIIHSLIHSFHPMQGRKQQTTLSSGKFRENLKERRGV